MYDPAISRLGNGARTFLFFNDDQAILDGISPLLEAKGHRVFAVGSGAAAFQVMEQHYREIDSLIIDCSISSSSGLELLNRFRSNGWKHPTVLCSNTFPEIKDHPDVQYWPEHVLAKPYCIDRLQNAISIALGAL